MGKLILALLKDLFEIVKMLFKKKEKFKTEGVEKVVYRPYDSPIEVNKYNTENEETTELKHRPIVDKIKEELIPPIVDKVKDKIDDFKPPIINKIEDKIKERVEDAMDNRRERVDKRREKIRDRIDKIRHGR